MKTKRIVTTALMLAIASLLSLFTPFHLPFGGGITIASMLPVVIVSYICHFLNYPFHTVANSCSHHSIPVLHH